MSINFDIPVYSTGIFDGSYIFGIGKQNKGTILQIRKNSEEADDLVYPPSLLGVTNLSQTDITNKLRLIPFFEDKNPKERLEWLGKNATTNNDLYLSDVGIANKKGQYENGKFQFEAKIIKLGGEYMLEHYSNVSTEEWFTVKELEQMVPFYN